MDQRGPSSLLDLRRNETTDGAYDLWLAEACQPSNPHAVNLGFNFVLRTWQSSSEAERVRKSDTLCRIETGKPPAVECISQQTYFGGGGNRSGDESMLNPSRRIAVVQMYKYSHIITYKGQVIHRFSGRSKPHIHWIIPKFGQHSSARELEAMTDGRHSLDGRIAVNLPSVIFHTPER